MTTDVVQFLVLLLFLVPGAAAEEMLPRVLGVGFPVLLAAVQAAAVRTRLLEGALFALAAGVTEDALASLPSMTSASFFLTVAVFTRCFRLPRGATVFASAFYQVWLSLWVPGVGGSVFGRVLVAVPLGWLAAQAVDRAYGWLAGKVAIGAAD